MCVDDSCLSLFSLLFVLYSSYTLIYYKQKTLKYVPIFAGHYGIPVGIVYSFPVRFDGQGNWTIVEGLDIDTTQREKMVNIANVSRP